MKDALGKEGEGIDVRFEFDQSPYVTRAVAGVVTEGLFGAVLVGLMILLFLRDWRSALVVVLNIPLALMAAVARAVARGQTINLMTLGGLALAIGILVDEATVAIENIHAQMHRDKPLAQAVLDGSAETAVPRLLAMLCILAVFVSSFFMQGAASSLFVPLSLAVGFAMLASYILSSTFVPVLCVWLLKHEHGVHRPNAATPFDRFRGRYERIVLASSSACDGCSSAAFLIATVAADSSWRAIRWGGAYFRSSMLANSGSACVPPTARTSRAPRSLPSRPCNLSTRKSATGNVDLTLGYVGMIHSNFPVNAVYQWSRGPEEAILYVDLNDDLGFRDEELKERLRAGLPGTCPTCASRSSHPTS